MAAKRGPVTQRDIARAAGVSLSVVSAVVSGDTHTRMSTETRERVLAAMATHNYVPNRAAQALRMRRAGSFAAVIHRLHIPMYIPLIQGIHDGARRSGRTVQLYDPAMLGTDSHVVARLLSNGSVDGVLLRDEGLLDQEALDALASRPTPILLIDTPRSSREGWIAIDDEAASAVATQHLLALGHEHIGFVGGDDRWHGSQKRFAGYRRAMLEAGATPLPHLPTGFAEAAGEASLPALRSEWPQVSAVVVNNVLTAVGLLTAAQDSGFGIPDELSMVAIHDAPVADFVRPRITRVKLPMYELGVRAVEALEARGSGSFEGVMKQPPPILIEGQTAASPRL